MSHSKSIALLTLESVAQEHGEACRWAMRNINRTLNGAAIGTLRYWADIAAARGDRRLGTALDVFLTLP